MKAPQAKMTMAIAVGIKVQPISRNRLPCTSLPISPGVLRRYLYIAKMQSAATNTTKKRQVRTMKKNSASTLPAKLDACSGKNGSGDCTALMCSLRRNVPARTARRSGAMITPAENDETDGQTEKSGDPTHANHGKDGRAVTCLGRIVLIAEQQNVIDRSADFSSGRVDQAETYVAGRIFHAEEIAGNAAVGSKQQDATGVAKHFCLRVVAIAEGSSLGDFVDGVFVSGQKMPARFRGWPGEAGQRFVLLLQSFIRSIGRIHADKDDVVLLARIKGNHFQRSDQRLFHLRAQHRAGEIDKGKNYWLLTKIIAEQNWVPILVIKRDIKGKLRVELRVEGDIHQSRRQSLGGLTNTIGNHLRRAGKRCQQQNKCDRRVA